MNRKLSVVLGLFLFLCVYQAIAVPVEDGDSTVHERTRRDINGIFDLIGSFFKADENGKSVASGILNSVFSAMGSIGKSAQGGGA